MFWKKSGLEWNGGHCSVKRYQCGVVEDSFIMANMSPGWGGRSRFRGYFISINKFLF
jgi:hypothetical protein